MNCVIISFSSRNNGNCVKISDFIRNQIPNSVHFSFSEFDISPCGRCEGECFARREACPHFDDMEKTLIQAVRTSDRAFFVVPNHCDYPCANFFIFNERSQCCFQGDPALLEQYLHVPKKFLVVSNSRSEHFRDAFTQHVDSEPEILFISAAKYGKQSISGNILSDERAQIDLLRYISKE